jgi:hypothetical protein
MTNLDVHTILAPDELQPTCTTLAPSVFSLAEMVNLFACKETQAVPETQTIITSP